ncbi:MAG: hypothetical protein ACI9MJ_001007 [Alphaproteobacteria bacterium]|jgi:hypothetical protein
MNKLSRVEPGPGQESVWDFPRPQRLEKVSEPLRVVFAGETVARTERGFWVLETSQPPVYYIPPGDVRQDFLIEGGAVLLRIQGRCEILVTGRRRKAIRKGGMELSNAIRGHLAELGLVAPIGRIGLQRLIETIDDETDERVPTGARLCIKMLADQLQLVNAQILENDRQIRSSARSSEVGRRLMEIPGIGPVIASALIATVPDPKAFRCGRNLSAWIGLVPRQNSSGGKERLGGITKQGNRYRHDNPRR